jgi:UrcA family protein
MMRLSMILIAAVSLTGAAHAASNADIVVVQDSPSARVSYADLNLTSIAGRERLASRIESAASELCTERNVEPLSLKLDRMRCYRAALSSGARQMKGIIQVP